MTEDPGPVLPSEREAGATAVCAETTRPVESAEALTSPRSRAGMPAAVGKEPREPQVHTGRGATWLARVVRETSCPAGTQGSSSKSSKDCRQQRDSTW